MVEPNKKTLSFKIFSSDKKSYSCTLEAQFSKGEDFKGDKVYPFILDGKTNKFIFSFSNDGKSYGLHQGNDNHRKIWSEYSPAFERLSTGLKYISPNCKEEKNADFYSTLKSSIEKFDPFESYGILITGQRYDNFRQTCGKIENDILSNAVASVHAHVSKNKGSSRPAIEDPAPAVK